MQKLGKLPKANRNTHKTVTRMQDQIQSNAKANLPSWARKELTHTV